LVSINKTRGVNMAGYDPAKAARMNALAQQYPKADLGVLADLARIDRDQLGNYTTDSVGTRAVNANFGRVTSEASQTVQSTDTPRNSAGSGSAFAGNTIPAPTVTSPASSETVTNTTGSGSAFQGGGTIASQAFGDRVAAPAPVPDTDGDEIVDAYAGDYTKVEPNPIGYERPGIQPDNTIDHSKTVDLPGDDYDQDFRTADDIARSNRSEVATPTPRPAPVSPPVPVARPSQEISQVDDFSGTPVPQVDDFGGPNRNITPVDDLAEYQSPAQVDDFAEIPAPAQVDDFSGYSNNDFGNEDPGLDAFGPGPTPPPATVTDYNQPQFDPFGDVVEPQAQVDDFEDYSDNNFGAQVDDFGDPSRNVTPVDDYNDYSDNDFGAEVDDYAEYSAAPPATATDWSDFDDQDDLDVYAEDYTQVEPLPAGYGTEYEETDEDSEVGERTDELAAANVDSYDEYGTRINDETQYDDFGNPIPPRVDNDGESLVGDDDTFLNDPDANAGIDGVGQAAISNAQTQAINAQAMKVKAQNQQTINEMREASGVKNADGDWRVKLRLAPQADYLYKAQDPGILAPLAVTDGIIFPYTPTIDVQYRAEYNNYQPTHSNYMHYFYKGSSVQTVQLQAEFTAQDTKEAEYLLACMHFLKSASKMFYGQDAQRGSPPPLLYLTGLGEYQFNEQPCVVSEFNLNLPNDVNYIRARSRHINRDDRLQFEKPLATTTTNGNFSALNRLRTAVTNALNGSPQPLQVGAKPFTPSPGKLGSKGATYVPTKMSMTINLLPIASRQQVSQQFSLKEYANGNLIKKGMW